MLVKLKDVFSKEIGIFIQSLCLQKGIEAYPESLNGFFLDLYIPVLNRAFMFHSIAEKDSDLHEIIHSERKIYIIHVWEDQWVYQRKKIESRILSLLGLTRKD